MKSTIWILAIVGLAWLAGCENEDPDPTNPGDSDYFIEIDPADFLPADSILGNTYFPMIVGRIMIYDGMEGSTVIHVEERVTDSIKVILGVDCRVVQAKEYEDGELIEDTYDWYAQDRSGNVWYFGEDSREIEGGQVVSTSGSWESGVDGALPGIIMMQDPLIGIWYRQEYYKGEAEDVAQVLSIGETMTVPYGTFTNCLRTLEYNPLEPGVEENKIYAPGVGLLRAVATRGGSELEELVAVVGP